MSTINNALSVYGLVITKEMLETAINEIADDEEPIAVENSYDLASYLGVDYESDFTGEAFRVLENGTTLYCHDCLRFENEELFYLALSNFPSLFNKTYKSMDEATAELKNTAPSLFPKDFDYAKNLVQIIGTYCG